MRRWTPRWPRTLRRARAQAAASWSARSRSLAPAGGDPHSPAGAPATAREPPLRTDRRARTSRRSGRAASSVTPPRPRTTSAAPVPPPPAPSPGAARAASRARRRRRRPPARPLRRRTRGPAVREPPPRRRARARRPSSPPGAASCCASASGSSDAARDLTHDYDELLGRLSYAAMPRTTGPTISFARGVPSLDIIDVDGLRDAAVRAFESDPDGHHRLRHVGRLPAPAQLDRRPPRRRARARARHQRLAAGRRLPVRRSSCTRATR